MQPSPAVTVVDVQIEPSPSGDLIFVSTRLQLNDSTRILSAISEDGGLRAVRSTIPWAVVLPRASSANRQEAYTPPLTPQIYSNMSLSTQKHYSGYIHRYFQKGAPLAWDFEVHVTRAHQRRLYLTQKDPFMFYANGGPVPTFVFTLHLETKTQTRMVTVKVDPNEVLQRKSLVEQRKTLLLAHLPQLLKLGTFTASETTMTSVKNKNSAIFSFTFPSADIFSLPRQGLQPSGGVISPQVCLESCGGSPPPPPPSLQIIEAKVEKVPDYIPPFHVARNPYKGESIVVNITIKNSGGSAAYSIYAKFRIVSDTHWDDDWDTFKPYYEDFDVQTGSLYVTSSLAAGSTKTITFNVGPTFENGKFVLNTGKFILKTATVWASNSNIVSKTINQQFTIESDPNKHVVFAFVLMDDWWGYNIGRSVDDLFDAIRPRFLERFSIDIRAMGIGWWDSGPHHTGAGLQVSDLDMEGLLNRAISEAGQRLELVSHNYKWDNYRDFYTGRGKFLGTKNYVGRTSRYNHGYDILVAFTGLAANHYGIAGEPYYSSALVTGYSLTSGHSVNYLGEADEWLQHEISHLFRADDNYGSEDVMDYQSFWGLWNWTWNLDPIRQWKTKSYNQMIEHVANFNGRLTYG